MKTKRTEIVLLFLPVLFLIGAGLLLRGHKGEFRFKTTDVSFRQGTTEKSSRSDMKMLCVTFHVGYEGPKPEWWGRDFNEEPRHFGLYDKNGKEYPCGLFGGTPTRFNPKLQQYEFVLDAVEVPKAPSVEGQARFEYEVDCVSPRTPNPRLGTVRVSAIVNARKQ